jgi:lipopolysaccharide export system protein LptA
MDSGDGGKIGTLFGRPGKLVTFRQKRDGGPDLWVEGEAEKVVYEEASEKIKLYKQAKVTLLDGAKRTHESSGDYISYDSRTDFMSVNNTTEGVSKPGAGLTNAVIYPNEKSPANGKATTPPAPLKQNNKVNGALSPGLSPARGREERSESLRDLHIDGASHDK